MALLNKGEISFRGSPESMLKRAEGKVWRLCVNDDDYQAINQKYPIIGLYAPCDETYPNNPDLLDRRIVFHPGDNLIQMKFHTLLQKGDTFDIISYKNAKETKVLMHLKNIVVE